MPAPFFKKPRKETCSKCGKKMEEKRKGKYAYCNDCHAEYMRLHRPKFTERQVSILFEKRLEFTNFNDFLNSIKK